MITITWRELRENLADMVNRVRYQNERIAITRHGKVVAELVPSRMSADQTAFDRSADSVAPQPHAPSAALQSAGLVPDLSR